MEINALTIKENRKKMHLTQLELAEIVGVSFRTIQNYEAGHVIPKSKHVILRKLFYDKTPVDYTTEEEKLPVVNEKSPPNYNSILIKLKKLIKELEEIEDPDLHDLKNLKDAYDFRSSLTSASE